MSKKPWEHHKDSGSEGDPLAARFVASLDYDTRLYKVDIRGSLAHATMLTKVGLITKPELKAIEKGLKEIEAEIEQQGQSWPGWKIELEDVHMCIEAALIEKTGDAGRKLHTGRSRNDQVALDLMLWIEESRDALCTKLDTLIQSFCDLADKQGRTVIPSYTHLQRAQPICLGGELLAWCEALDGCIHRLESMLLNNPLGSGAIAGSTLPLDRVASGIAMSNQTLSDEEKKEIVEETRSFLRASGQADEAKSFTWEKSQQMEAESMLTQNAMYATASRDVAIDFVYALSMASMWLSRWAEQWIIYATTEFSFLTLDAKYTTGSSMMPQKQNPDMLELIRGRCGNVYGNLMALLTMCKAQTIGYNRDLQEDKRHVFAAFDTVSDCLQIATGIVQTAKFNEARIKAGLDRGFLDATSLAEYLVTKGVPFRTSHQMVGRLVHACHEKGHGKLAQLTVEQMRQIADTQKIADDVYGWLGPDNVVKRYQSMGNAGLAGYEAQLKSWKERMASD